MTAQTYTHRDLAQALGVSETTIKSYRSKFPAFLPVARLGKPVRLHPESLEVCRRIRDLFAEGMSILQTTQALRTEFKEYPQNRRLPTPQSAAAGRPLSAPAAQQAEDGLGARLDALAQAQDQTRQRMEQLELELRNLATLEAASKALVAQLVEEFRASRLEVGQACRLEARPEAGRQTAQESGLEAAQESGLGPDGAAPGRAAPHQGNFHQANVHQANPHQAAPQAAGGDASGHAPGEAPRPAPDRAGRDHPTAQDGPTVLTARKIVTLHGPAGPVASYALGREPSPPQPFPEPEAPPSAFLDLPAVIRSERGDFLGLPGGQSVRRLVHVLRPEGAPAPAWMQEGPEAWTCAIPLGRAQTRELFFERTTTPRGNLVGHIRRMRINDAEATQEQLQEIFRQLRDQLA